MKTKTLLAIGLILISGAILSCKKEEPPAPAPEPTEVPAPPPPAPGSTAVCREDTPSTSPPVCKDSAGVSVECPTGYETLPICQ